MKTCKYKNCLEPVMRKPDKNSPSIRVAIPPQSGSDTDKRFIYVFSRTTPASDYCYYHRLLQRQRNFEADMGHRKASDRLHPEIGVIKGY